MRRLSFLVLLALSAFSSGAMWARADEPAGEKSAETAFVPLVVEASEMWHTDYQQAMKLAAEGQKMLLVYFYDERPSPARDYFEQQTLKDTDIQAKLGNFVLARLPLTASITVDGKTVTLLKHAAFKEMLGRPGVAVVDLAHKAHYGYVVTTIPFYSNKFYTKQGMAIVLNLPPGTLTQRTMIFAVRLHPEAPASTQGQLSPVLTSEARSHSDYQAAITLQGHHSWENRFHRINAKIPTGLMAQEVVAESWPNEGLVEACVDCVDSWRQSPGHWGAVRSRHPLFGYDIKRGRNGIWYATGIFGRR